MVLKIALLVAALVTRAPAQQRNKGGGGQPVQPIQQVKPDLYVIAGAGANSEVRVTNDGLIVVDGKLAGEQTYNALVAQIKSVTSQP